MSAREKPPYDFEDLFVLDMANNHEGDLDHALEIVRKIGEVVAGHGVKAALKFQFRDLSALIHPDHQEGSDNKHIPRFLKNALTFDEFQKMTDAVRKAGMITMSTPFDEPSVQMIDDLDIEIIKVASCSAGDWPLLEEVASFNRPVILSTGGLSLAEIDDVVSFFDHQGVDFALMHCVAIYPTPPDQLQLNQIAAIKRRHPTKVVGFSTHEDPADTDPVLSAVAQGAQMLERHVGVETDERKLNKYSSTPELLGKWFASAKKARAMCGAPSRVPATQTELDSLLTLRRGIFAKRKLKAGESLLREDVYFAMPAAVGQWASGDWKEGAVIGTEVPKNGAVDRAEVDTQRNTENEVLIQAVHEIKAMMNEARIAPPRDFLLEFSHHAGKLAFRETGATIINCINRDYCKKLIVQLPGQFHPRHCHKRKEESFQILSGELELEIDSRQCTLVPGDIIVVPRGVWHSFRSKGGVIFEEVSTTHFNDDSFYDDKEINRMPRDRRKTKVRQWGDYQWD